MRLFLAFFTFIFLINPAMAQDKEVRQEAKVDLEGIPAGTYQLDKTHASLIWKVSHLGLSDYTARFTDFDATLEFDPKDPAKSKLVVTINPMSVETDYPNEKEKDFNKILATEEGWFNAGKFPEIKFESTEIQLFDVNRGFVVGDLTFLGQTLPFSFQVKINGAMKEHPFSHKPALGFSAQGQLKRSVWGMDKYIPTVADIVTVNMEVEFQGEEPVVELNE